MIPEGLVRELMERFEQPDVSLIDLRENRFQGRGIAVNISDHSDAVD